MSRITNWRAYRSGASISIQGFNEAGEGTLLSKVESVAVYRDKVIAVTKSGERHELVAPAAEAA